MYFFDTRSPCTDTCGENMFAEFQHTAIRARMHAVSTSEYIELQINFLIIE